MSDLFHLPIDQDDPLAAGPFAQFGLEANPFPPTGVTSGVLYTRHMTGELDRINRWIDEVGEATRLDREEAGPVQPLAIFGSLGVGKTHLLNFIERGLSQNAHTPTPRKGLADEGMSRIVLANLFLRYLPFSEVGSEPGTGYLGRLVAAARRNGETRRRMEGCLRDGSPLKVPFFTAVRSDDDRMVTWLARWLRREYTTPAQRSRLGLSGVLQSEGEVIRAVADLARLGHAARVLRAWFILIDQLEELWRPNVITPTRRARFLTDLRHLVDQAREGAPIALLLAWNTTVEDRLVGGADVQDQMQRDYRALWQRLEQPVNLPPLREEDVWPFAEAYLRAAKVTEDNRLYQELKASTDDVLRALKAQGPTGLAPRKVLEAWRERAEAIATGTR